MSLRTIPLMLIPFLAYNLIVFLSGGTADEVMGSVLFGPVTMPSTGQWTFRLGDLLVILSLVILFLELIKATFVGNFAIADHATSMVVFVIMLIMFILVPATTTSTFFIMMVIALIDVIAGFSIGIRMARRDIGVHAGQVGGGIH